MRKLLGWSVKSPESGPGWLSWSVSQLLHIHIISLLAGEGRSWLSGSPMPHSWDQLSHAAAQVPRLIPLRFFYEFCFLLSSVALKVSVLSWKERNVDTSGQKKKDCKRKIRRCPSNGCSCSGSPAFRLGLAQMIRQTWSQIGALPSASGLC